MNTKDRRKQNRFFFYYVKYQPRGGKHIIKIGTVQNSELIVSPFFFFFLTFYIGFGGWKEDVLVSSAVQVKVESACLAVLRNTTLYITSCFILSFRAREHFANLSSESDARPYAISSSSLSTVTPSVWLGVEIAQLPWRMFDLGWAIVARERERDEEGVGRKIKSTSDHPRNGHGRGKVECRGRGSCRVTQHFSLTSKRIAYLHNRDFECYTVLACTSVFFSPSKYLLFILFFFLLKKRYGRHRDSPSLQILFFSCCVSLPFGLAYCVALYSVEWRPCKKSVKVRLGSSSVRSKVQHWEIKVRAEIGSQFAVGSTSE